MARAFDGVADVMTRANPTGFNLTADFSFGLWVKRTNTSDNRGIVMIGGPGGGSDITRGFGLMGRSGGAVDLRWGGGISIQGGTQTGGVYDRVGVLYDALNGSSQPQLTLVVNGVEVNSASGDAIAGLNGTTDGISLGDMISAFSDGTFLGELAGPFFVQTLLTAAALDNYLNSTGGKTPCSLLTDYGTSGGITANALKAFYLLQSGAPTTDISGVSNTLTDVGTTNGTDPSGFPTSCPTGTNVNVTGQEITTELGTALTTRTAPVTGQEITTELGSPNANTAGNINANATGQEITTELGTPISTVVVPVVGLEITTEMSTEFAVDLVTSDIQTLEITTELGTFSSPNTVNVVGLQIGTELGTLALSGSVAVVGQEITTELGSMFYVPFTPSTGGGGASGGPGPATRVIFLPGRMRR